MAAQLTQELNKTQVLGQKLDFKTLVFKNFLYQSKNFESVNFSEYLAVLTKSLVHTYAINTKKTGESTSDFSACDIVSFWYFDIVYSRNIKVFFLS